MNANLNTQSFNPLSNFAASFAQSSTSSTATQPVRSTAEFLLRVANKRQYVRAIQALRRA